MFFAPTLIVFAALPLADQLGCELLLSLESILPGADGAVAFVGGRLQGLTDAFELGLQTLKVVTRALERALHLISFLRQPAALFRGRVFDVLTLLRELVRPPAFGIELLGARLSGGDMLLGATALGGELLLDARAFACRLLFPLPPQSGGFLLEPGTFCGRLLLEAGSFGGRLFFEPAAFGGVLVHPRAQLGLRARPFPGKLLLGPRSLFPQRPFELLAYSRRALGSCLLGLDTQPRGFGNHPALGVGTNRRDLRFEPGGPFVADLLDTSRPALLRIRLGGTAGALDFLGVACGDLRQLSFELLVQPATYRVDRRTKRIFSHFWHYRGG